MPIHVHLDYTAKLVAAVAANGDIVTGTTAQTKSRSILIPAGTLAVNSTLIIRWTTKRLAGTAGVIASTVWINSSDTLVGATLIATGGNLSTAQNRVANWRHIQKVGTNAETAIASTQVSNDGSTSASATTFTLDNSADVYVIFAQQTLNAGDQSVVQNTHIEEFPDTP